MAIFNILQIVFIVLKLLDLIHWDWWLVFAPTYISIILSLLIVFVVILLDKVGTRSKKWNRW